MNILKLAKICLPALLLCCTACDEDYLIYDDSYTGVYFTRDTLRYSFGVTPVEQRTMEFRVPVRIMGTLASYDRPFAYEVVADSTTAVLNEQYTIGLPVIEADSINGYIPVTFLRDGLKGDYENGYVRYKLGLRLIGNNFFVPTLDAAAQMRVIVFDNAIEKPQWLDWKNDPVWSESKFGKWHPLKLIKIVEFFHKMEEFVPETYAKMVEKYGPNLERSELGGDHYPFATAMNKYIYGPTYEYFANPDNREEILALYPDFPFDYPNPFGEE